MLSEQELMEHHVHVMFRHDTQNRMTFVNEPPFDAAPRIFVGATRSGNIVRFSSSLNQSIAEKLENVLLINTGVEIGAVIKVLSLDQIVNVFSFGPAYVFPERVKTGTKALKVNHQNKEILKPHFPYTFEDFEYKQPCFIIIEDNIPVSICCSARQTSKADEPSLYTHEDYRGRGYGVEVAKAWAAEVQKQGRIALYSTSWDNFSSQSVARKLQLVQYGTDIHIS